MALSVPPSHTTWERTLPNPATLLPIGIAPRRSSSLLQHHISSIYSEHSMSQNSATGARGSIVVDSNRQHEYDEMASREEDAARPRQDSVMSTDDLTETSSEETSPQEIPSGFCLCAPDPKIPRPRNAFILYRQNQHASVVKIHPGLPNPDISKIIGEQWRCLSVEEKAKWKAFAEQEKARHSQQFPDYRYRPRRSTKYASIEGVSQSNSQTTTCSKCGGKTMNPPHTPHYSTLENSTSTNMQRPQKRPYSDGHVQARTQPLVHIATAPYSAPIRYGYAPRHESIHYHQPLHIPHGSPGLLPPVVGDSPDAKRRRMNASYPPRASYDHSYHDRERNPYNHEPYSRPMPPPPSHIRPVHLMPPSSGPPRPIIAAAPRRDPSLVLPPLKTGPGSRASIPNSTQTQKSGVEAMIMSYPVLTKLKTLHSITPLLSNPGPSSPQFQVRGAIIAVEGLDQKKVMDMTQSLAEQLGKEDKFMVKVFAGPDPYQPLQLSRRASIRDDSEAMTAEKYLHLISEWHKVSKDIIAFITPESASKFEVNNNPDAMVISTSDRAETSNHFDRPQTTKSPISSVSPKTLSRTEKLQLDAPKTGSTLDSSPHITRSRIPQAAIEFTRRAKEAAEQAAAPSSLSQLAATPDPTKQHDKSSLVPIAIVPHYQLTTVDTCSIALPITDNYDPLTHWRWHATLWRGCVGPDVSIVIKSAHEAYEDESLDGNRKPESRTVSELAHARVGSITGRVGASPPSGAPPVSCTTTTGTGPNAGSSPTPFGVEVRLADHRAVIVRATGTSTRSNQSIDLLNETDKDAEKDNENWEKAKRRVGFEVEEWMRR